MRWNIDQDQFCRCPGPADVWARQRADPPDAGPAPGGEMLRYANEACAATACVRRVASHRTLPRDARTSVNLSKPHPFLCELLNMTTLVRAAVLTKYFGVAQQVGLNPQPLLRRLGLTQSIRAKEEINKEAILNEPEAIKGVAGISISQGEDFVIVPFETELAEVA